MKAMTTAAVDGATCSVASSAIDQTPELPLSICVPTYNGEPYIRQALESILSQSYRDFEVIVVDDGSTDQTLSLVKLVQAGGDPRLQLYQNSRRLGIARNWNRCLELAVGEYVCIFHQDDTMLPDNLARKMAVLHADPRIGFVHSLAALILEAQAPTTLGDWMEQAEEDFVCDGLPYFRKLLLHGDCICAPTVVAQRKAVLEVGGFDEDLGYACDYEMWLKLCVNKPVAFLRAPLVQYRWHAHNASHAYRFGGGIEECETAMQRGLAYYRAQTDREVEVQVLAEALSAIVARQRWAVELDQGRAWLEEQWHEWRAIAEQKDKLVDDGLGYIEELERGKQWLEGQWRRWQQIATEREQQQQIQQQQIQELEHGKRWVEEQYGTWQDVARDRERTITTLQTWIAELEQNKKETQAQLAVWQEVAEGRMHAIVELKGWIAELEQAKKWLADQWTNWQTEAQRWQTEAKGWKDSSWGRLGLRLGIMKPVPSASERSEAST